MIILLYYFKTKVTINFTKFNQKIRLNNIITNYDNTIILSENKSNN